MRNTCCRLAGGINSLMENTTENINQLLEKTTENINSLLENTTENINSLLEKIISKNKKVKTHKKLAGGINSLL